MRQNTHSLTEQKVSQGNVLNFFKQQNKKVSIQYIDGRQSVECIPNVKCQKIVLSDRAFAQIYNETKEKINNETGGLLLGHYIGGTWYVVESGDPGYKAVFRHAYHESDEDYVNHVCAIISRTYKYQLTFLGMWHRHPGSFDSFSGTDDATNVKYAKSAGNGCISLLINKDPDFRITAYYVEIYADGINYTKTDVILGDEHFIRRDIMVIASKSDIDNR